MRLTSNGTFLFYTSDTNKIFKIIAATGTIQSSYQVSSVDILYTLDISSLGTRMIVGGGIFSTRGYFVVWNILTNAKVVEYYTFGGDVLKVVQTQFISPLTDALVLYSTQAKSFIYVDVLMKVSEFGNVFWRIYINCTGSANELNTFVSS
jgi:hypothetical protein